MPLKFDAIKSWQDFTAGQVTITSAVEDLSSVSVSLLLASVNLTVVVMVPQLAVVVGADAVGGERCAAWVWAATCPSCSDP